MFQEFRSATQPLPQPFYIYFDKSVRGVDMLQTSVEINERTGEQLTIMPMPPTYDDTV
jgi:hypothetical protein